MAKLYYGKVTAVGWSATSAQEGYPASNVSLESIARNWRGASAGALDVVITLPPASTVNALLLQDVNFASCPILKSSDGSSFSSVGTFTSYADKLTGRRRGVIDVSDANVKALKISIGAGSPTDGFAYWRIGSAYPFAQASTFPKMADYRTRVRGIFPKVSVELVNKQVPQATIGQDILNLSFPFLRASSEDVLEMLRRGRLGTVGLSISNTNYPELVLPAKYIDETQEESLDFYNYSTLVIDMREVT